MYAEICSCATIPLHSCILPYVAPALQDILCSAMFRPITFPMRNK